MLYRKGFIDEVIVKYLTGAKLIRKLKQMKRLRILSKTTDIIITPYPKQ